MTTIATTKPPDPRSHRDPNKIPHIVPESVLMVDVGGTNRDKKKSRTKHTISLRLHLVSH